MVSARRAGVEPVRAEACPRTDLGWRVVAENFHLKTSGAGADHGTLEAALERLGKAASERTRNGAGRSGHGSFLSIRASSRMRCGTPP